MRQINESGPRGPHILRTLIFVAAVLLIGFMAGTGAVTLGERVGLWQSDAAASSQSAGQESSELAAEVGAPAASDPADAHASSYVPPAVTAGTWDEAESPNYYRVLGSAQVGEQPAAGTVAYGALDSLGRPTGAVSVITYESMEAGRARERGDLRELRPAGWGHNEEVDIAMPDGSVYHGQIFNRSHLVAKSLGGDDELHNLVTATRTQNVGANVNGTEGGMAYVEGLARTWLESHPDGTVYYAATPAYRGDELLARSVIVDVRSSDGSLDQRVEVFNAARGFVIDYATGTFEVTEDAEAAAADIRARMGDTAFANDAASTEGEPTRSVQPTGTSTSEGGERKVIVTGSGKAYHHDETCKGLTNARSMEWVTVSEAEGMGRHPCGICGG